MSQPRNGDDQFSLAALTPAELAGLASAEAGRPVPVAGVSVTPIDYDWGSPATAGLWRVDARATARREGSASIVLRETAAASQVVASAEQAA